MISLSSPLAPNQLCLGENQIAEMRTLRVGYIKLDTVLLHFHSYVKFLDKNVHETSHKSFEQVTR